MAVETKKTKVVDKWKMKSWYAVLAPTSFDSREIGQIVATEESTVPNRVIVIGLGELTGSFSQSNAYTNLKFRVSEVKGKTAYTKLIGHELVPGYIRTLARRRRSIVHSIDDAITKDGTGVRVKSIALCGGKVSTGARSALRHAISQEVIALAKETEFATFAQEMIFGKVAAKVFGRVKKIAPVRRIEIRKSEVKEKFT
jgi:small subunit ribosomal protein S3Ae